MGAPGCGTPGERLLVPCRNCPILWRKRLLAKAGTADRDKLNEYLESVRSVETRLVVSETESAKRIRERLAGAAAPPPGVPGDHKTCMRLMFDMMHLAFWSESTRVCTFMLDHEQTNRYFNFLPGVSGMWHALSHWKDISGKTEDDDGRTSWSSLEVKYRQYMDVIRYHHEQVAYFFGKLKETREADGTLLDNVMILYGSPFSDGNEHSSDNLPMLIAGRAGGRLKTGLHRVHPGAPAEGVYISMLDVMGVRVERMGETSTAIPIA